MSAKRYRLWSPLGLMFLSCAVLAQDFDADPPTPCLGVNVRDLQDVIFGNAAGSWEYEGVKNGVPVVNVNRGSPAALIGLRIGDFIVSMDGRAIYLAGELVSRVRELQIGERVEIEIYRRGEFLRARGVLGKLVGDLCQPAAAPRPRSQ
ncbi:MAG: PDZ domain-containing protein [Pseudomonadota bacterium]